MNAVLGVYFLHKFSLNHPKDTADPLPSLSPSFILVPFHSSVSGFAHFLPKRIPTDLWQFLLPGVGGGNPPSKTGQNGVKKGLKRGRETCMQCLFVHFFFSVTPFLNKIQFVCLFVFTIFAGIGMKSSFVFLLLMSGG